MGDPPAKVPKANRDEAMSDPQTEKVIKAIRDMTDNEIVRLWNEHVHFQCLFAVLSKAAIEIIDVRGFRAPGQEPTDKQIMSKAWLSCLAEINRHDAIHNPEIHAQKFDWEKI